MPEQTHADWTKPPSGTMQWVVNYLAHLFLAEDHAASRIGNLLGDFVTGPPESIQLPPAVVAGIIRHRATDRLTDDHPAVAAARNLFSGGRRRFANPILDICFDHFLARSWQHLHPTPMRDFLDLVYQEQRNHCDWLPSELADGLEERIADDWLGHYASEAGLQEVFERVASRRPNCAIMATAMTDFHTHRAALKSTFEAFLPDLQSELAKLGPERLALKTSPPHP